MICQSSYSAAIKDALRLRAVGFDAVRHLLLCRIESRPPKLDLASYPYLQHANVEGIAVRQLGAHGTDSTPD